MSENVVAKRVKREIRRVLEQISVGILWGTLVAQPVWSQSTNPGNLQSVQSPPSRLQIKILSPTPLTEPAGALSANQLAVQVVDAWGMPVPGATVSFRLPEAGPGGVFLNGLSTEVAIADREGKAEVKGFDWRAEAGSSFLHVIAAYGDIRAGAMVEIQLGRTVAEVPPAGASAIRPPPSEAPPTSAFPLPAAASPDSVVLRKRPQVGEAPGAEDRLREEILGPNGGSPREATPKVRAEDYQSPTVGLRGAQAVHASAERSGTTTETNTGSYVTVRRKSGGSNKMLVILVVAAAAAGGALAAGMASGGSSGSGGNPGTPTTPTVTIGSPTITVSGGSN